MRIRSTASCSTSSARDVDGRRRPAPIRTPEEVPQVGGCSRLARAGDLLRSAPGDDAATLLAAFGTEVDHAVRGRDDVQVVLDDDDAIAPVHEPLQRGDELCDVRQIGKRCSWRKVPQKIRELVSVLVEIGCARQMLLDLVALGVAWSKDW